LEWGSKFDAKKQHLNVHPLIANFVGTYGEKVFYTQYDPENPPKTAIDPRGWEQVSDIIYDNKGVLARELIQNKVGNEITASLIEFAQKAPITVQDVIAGNYTYSEIPTKFDAKYALALSLRYAKNDEVAIVRDFIQQRLNYFGGIGFGIYTQNKDGKLKLIEFTTDNEYEFMIKDLKPKNFYFCGDSCQSIYSFKGSNYHHFMRLVRDPSVTVFNLTYNYRCGADIIDYADTILASVTDIYKVPNVCMTARRGYVEVNQFEIHKILQELEMGEEYRSWFILCRTNKEVDDMIKVLEKNDIPCDTFKKADLDLSQLQERMKENTVKVLTIHTSKGLENDNVMVIGAHRWNDEEKRISYVAATRARNSLFWFIPKKAAAPRKKKENLSYMEF